MKNVFINREPKVLRNIHLRFMNLDMLSIVYPRAALLVIKRFIIYILRCILIVGAAYSVTAKVAPSFFELVFRLFGTAFNAGTTVHNLMLLTFFTILTSVYIYISAIVVAVYIFVMERKRIQPIKWYKKIWFCLTFPLFDVIGRFSVLVAFFKKVEWLPIPHKVNIKIDDIKQ